MREQSNAVQPLKTRPSLHFLQSDNFMDRMKTIYDLVAKRAYEIFDGDGRVLGRDLDYWLRAESEVLHPAHVTLAEFGNALTLRIEVPGFSAKELEVGVEAGRVAISGKRESRNERKTEKVVCTERCSDQVFRVLDLPVDINPSKTMAELKDGVLELVMQKASAKKSSIEPKAA